MPWRGPEEEGEFPTLGYAVADYIEALCVIPDGPNQADPFVLTDEQLRFLLHHYRLRPTAVVDVMKPGRAWVNKESQLVRPQKWGKGPFAAAHICAEAKGPVLFDGWDANGDPVGRPWATPWIQVTAAAEDQTDNIWNALLPMIQLGPLADIIPDTGFGRINVPSNAVRRGQRETKSTGGFIEPVSANALTRLGQRLTFDVHDETGLWLASNRGHWLYQTKRRNLAGMQGRSVQHTNAWDPSEDSVAQRTDQSPRQNVHRDNRRLSGVDTSDPVERRRVFAFVYGDSASAPAGAPWKPWVDLDSIEDGWKELAEHDQPQADRFFANVIGKSSAAAFDAAKWLTLRLDFIVPKRSLITLGFDGAKFFDSTGLVATHVEEGHQFVVGEWERPEDADDDWEIDTSEVTAALDEVWKFHKVWRLYGDPPYWEDVMDAWAGKYGERKIVKWWTNRPRQMCFAVRNYTQAMAGEKPAISHDGNDTLARHIANSRRLKTNVKDDDGKTPLHRIAKEFKGSPNKIDLAMAGCLSWEARGDCIASGGLKRARRGGGFSMS